MTDIVERLRSVGGIEGTGQWYINPDGPEAADEIARLRAALTAMRDHAKAFSNHSWDTHADYFRVASAALEKK